MKQMFKLLSVLLLFASCTPGYEKTIADWVQTDKAGTWTDLKFKLIEVVETKDLTVGDSVRILENEVKRLNKIIDRAENRKSMVRVAPSTYFDACDKLKSTRHLLESSYADRDTTEIIARYLKCKYSIFSPELQTKQIKVETFLLTPDQNKCLGRMKKNI